MSGLGFGAAAEEYAAAGIVPLPLGREDGKRPLVRHPQKFGIKASLEIAPKFPNANLGFWCGQRNKLTVVDIDSPRESELRWALNTFGASPVIVRTGSGKHHIWYEYGGERRKIRPFPGHDIDLLGEGGLCVAPPSVRPGGGAYVFVEGSLADVALLSPIRRDALRDLAADDSEPTGSKLRSVIGVTNEGRRNDALFALARTLAREASTKEALLSQLRQANAEMNMPPLPDGEVVRSAGSAWRYKQSGRLWSTGTQHIVLDVAKIEPLMRAGEADAALMLLRLQKAHGGRLGSFAASPEGMAECRLIGAWDKRRYRNAVRRLCDLGLLEKVAAGGRGPGDPAKYRLSG